MLFASIISKVTTLKSCTAHYALRTTHYAPHYPLRTTHDSQATPLKLITAKAPPPSSGPLDILLPLGAVGLVVALAAVVLGGSSDEAKPDMTPVPTPAEPAAAPAAEPAATAAEVAAVDDAPMPMPPP